MFALQMPSSPRPSRSIRKRSLSSFDSDGCLQLGRIQLAVWTSLLTIFAASTLSAAEPIFIQQAQTQLIHNTVVPSRVAGVVRELHVTEGQWVEQGQRLAVLDDSRAIAQRAAAKAAYEAALVRAESDIDREYATRTQRVREREFQQSRLANQQVAGSVPDIEMERLRLLVEQAELSVQQAEHARRVAVATASEQRAALHLAELKIAHHQVFAPVQGQVAERLADAGSWVDVGGPLVRLISLDPIRISGFLDGNRFDNSLVGAAVEFRWKYPKDGQVMQFQGRVIFVSDELNPITGEVKLWAEIANPDHVLRPGMKGDLQINPKPNQND